MMNRLWLLSSILSGWITSQFTFATLGIAAGIAGGIAYAAWVWWRSRYWVENAGIFQQWAAQISDRPIELTRAEKIESITLAIFIPLVVGLLFVAAYRLIER